MQRRPERTADDRLLDHQTFTKIVMGAALGIIVYFTMNQKTSQETPLARRSEFLNGKRSQMTLCAPPFKREIENLDKSKYKIQNYAFYKI